MNKKTKLRNEYYMRVAELTALNSCAKRTKVGAILVKDGRILSSGWNGTAHARPDCCEIENEDGTLTTKDEVIHSEANAIYFCAKNGISTDNTTLYVTLSPCIKCCLGIIQAGIKEVFYRNEYRDPSGIAFLRDNGIKVQKLDPIEMEQ